MGSIIIKINKLLGQHNEKILNAPFANKEFVSLVTQNQSYKLLKTEIMQGEDDKIYKDYIGRMNELQDIFFELSAYMEILDDIYAGKVGDVAKMGNFISYVHKSIAHFVVIKLKELLVGNRNICLCKMEKFLRGNKRQLFDDFKIKAYYQIDNTNKVFEIVRPVFNIVPLLDLIKEYIEYESETIKMLKVARNEVCGHLPTKESYEEIKDLCYKDLCQLYEELYDIFNAIFLAQNWNKPFKPTRVSHGIGLDYINNMARYGEETKRKEIDELRKELNETKI